ncbi:helix-turn-helix domain-containing protein [Desulfothermus naphthae]
MSKRMNIEWREGEKELLELYKREQDVEIRSRLHAFWLLRKGYSVAEVKKVLGIHERTLRRRIAWYRSGGIEEVRRRKKGGRQGRECWLSAEQKEQLKAKAAEGVFKTIQDAVEWVAKEFKVKYSYWGMRSLFVRLGIKKKVPRPKAEKACAEAQKEWKKGGLLQLLGSMG